MHLLFYRLYSLYFQLFFLVLISISPWVQHAATVALIYLVYKVSSELTVVLVSMTLFSYMLLNSDTSRTVKFELIRWKGWEKRRCLKEKWDIGWKRMIITWFKIVTFHRRRVALNFNIIWGDKCRMCPNLEPSAITFIVLIPRKKSLEYVQLKVFIKAC